jgi:hypothetical protein
MRNIKYEISLLKFTNEDLTGLSTRVEELENKILDRLKQEYKNYCSKGKTPIAKNIYYSMRTFCLDCELVSFNDIGAMEFEVNQSF